MGRIHAVGVATERIRIFISPHTNTRTRTHRQRHPQQTETHGTHIGNGIDTNTY